MATGRNDFWRWPWNPFQSRFQRWLLVTVGATLLASGLWFSAILEPWEARSWDIRATWLARPSPASDQIALILLDQASLDWAREESGLTWPWPRELYGVIADFVARTEVRALAFDVLFSEPSFYGVGDDQRFAESLARVPAVLALFASREENRADRMPRGPAGGVREPLDWTGAEHLRWPGLGPPTLPIPELRDRARLGNVSAAPDPDGVYRHMQPLGHRQGQPLPSLGLAAYLRAHPGAVVRVLPGRLELPGGRRVPLDDQGRVLLRYRGPSGTHTAFSAGAILQSELHLASGAAPVVQPEELAGRYVLFGFSAPGLLDLRPTPMGGVYPGVEINATLLDNLLQGDFARRVPSLPTLVLVLLLAAVTTRQMLYHPSAQAMTLNGGVLLLLPTLLAMAAYRAGYWLPWIWPQAGVLLAVTATVLLNYAVEGRQKRFIRRAFQHYLSPRVIEQIVQHPERLRLGGERRVLTIFFSDLEGFTSLSERLSPDQLTDLLNHYLSAMTDIIQEEGGTVDKYEGDAIIAFWNAPLELTDHALHGVRAAMRCQQKLAELRPEYRQWTGQALNMRIGMHTGPAVVGNMGSRTRFDYTMLGDAVNLAARLEGVNKRFASGTLVSQDTQALVADSIPMREIGRVAVVGRKTPVTLFQPLPEDMDALQQAHFTLALRAFYQGDFGAALAQFLALADHDPVAAAYLHHCLSFLRVPPPDWAGVWALDSK
jgi:adenylate cyclase